MDDLSLIRKQIDKVDGAIVKLLETRVGLAGEVARIKNEQGNIGFTDALREQEILKRLQIGVTDPILHDCLEDIFVPIFAVSKKVRHMAKQKVSPFGRIGIIGDGLMGRSLYKLIRAKDKKIGLVIQNHDFDVKQFAGCELVIIATPIDAVVDVAKQIVANAYCFSTNLVVVDIASVKQVIYDEFAKLTTDKIVFVPTHPMSGTQRQGNAYAKTTLFAGNPWMICKCNWVAKSTLGNIEKFIQFCGSTPTLIDVSVHDKQVAYISHLPGIISKSLLNFVQKECIDSIAFAGPAFESMTRVGKTDNIRLRSQIAKHNKENIAKITDDFIHFLKHYNLSQWI